MKKEQSAAGIQMVWNGRGSVHDFYETTRIFYENRGFIKVLIRKAIEFDTRAKNWQGPEGLAPRGGLGAYSPRKF